MISFQKKNFSLVRRYSIVGGRRLSNYCWSIVTFFGGCGFLLTGISSYFNRSLLLVTPLLCNTCTTTALPPLPSLPPSVVQIGEAVQKTEIAKGVIKKELISNVTQKGLEVVNGIPTLSFFPQGLVLSFYGFLALCFSFHLWFTLIWKIGAGFNEFNGKKKYVRVFRWGRPGKNRRIDFKYTHELIETIKIELVPKPALFLRVKGEKNIPLTRAGEFIPLEDLETQAAELTSLLQIPLEIEN